MTPLFLARRSAERFDSQVEGRRDRADDPATAELLELVGALRSVPGSMPQAQARPEFVSDLRERLMLAAATELTPAEPTRQRDDVARLTIKRTRTHRERRIGIALGAAAIVGATTSMAVASQSAIPGDALYPVKRAIENAQAGFSVGDDAKGETMLGNASTRLDEVGKLTQKKQPDAKLVAQTLKTFTQQFTDGSHALLADYAEHSDPASIQQIHQNAADSVDALSGLELVVPPAAHEALVDAANIVFALDADAVNVCADPACGEGLLEMPASLVAGAAEHLTGAVDDALDGVAGGQLSGTTPPAGDATGAAQPQQQPGVKGQGGPSGLHPPETPITLPVAPTSDATADIGDVLTGGHHGDGGSGDNGGKGGKGGKHHVEVDLTPVTDTVNQVVTGVVEGVTGVLNGLTGK
jgi:hypothetical protein